MSTRGLYGFRKDGIDKTTYNHSDSYPDCLGAAMLGFCAGTSNEEMRSIFDRIILVNEADKPTPEQIEACKDYIDLTVSTQSANDWYCLLRNLQGEPEEWKQIKGSIFMIDNHNFIKDSLFCEYAYIIDLDEEVLEYWIGFQRKPDPLNPYGDEKDEDGYFPCKKLFEFSLEELRCTKDVEGCVARMKEAEKIGEIIDAAEAVGFDAEFRTDEGGSYIEFSASSPECSEELRFVEWYEDIEELPSLVKDEYSAFNPDDHAVEQYQFTGDSLSVLLQDAHEIEGMLRDLWDAIEACF